MTSKTFFKQWPIFKGALKRLKWLSILYGVALALVLPLAVWIEFSNQKTMQGAQWAGNYGKLYLSQIFFNPLEIMINIIVPVVFGLILFQYLQTERGSTFFHSLPIKRASLYGQNLLAGLVMIWVPILINALLLYGVFGAFGVTEGQWNHMTPASGMVNGNGPEVVPLVQVFAYWLCRSLLLTAIFFIFTIFVGMLTGNVLLQGVLTYIGLGLPLGIDILLKFNFSKLLYGYPYSYQQITTEWLSPLVNYIDGNRYLLTDGWRVMLGYLVLAGLLCGATIYLYKLRHAESAGETLAAGWIRGVFKYGVTACAALLGGLYFTVFNINYSNNMGLLYLGYFIGAVLGYIVADMIAYKTFRFYERWKGMLIFGAVFILLMTAVKLDFFGYEKYVPQQAEVKEVLLSNLNRDGLTTGKGLTGETNITLVRQFHQQIIKREQENRVLTETQQQMSMMANPAGYPVNLTTADITYVLNNGEKVIRTYTIDAAQYREFLKPIVASPEAKRIMYGRLFSINANNLERINLSNYHFNRNVSIYNPADVKAALAALRKDVMQISYAAAMEGKVPARANIELVAKLNRQMNYNDVFSLSYYAEFKNFEAFLATHGYLDRLILQPSEIKEVVVKKVGTQKAVAVKNQQGIKTLLDWCSIESEKEFMMRTEQVEGKELIEYYGKVIQKDGTTLYIVFESNPYTHQVIAKIVNGR